MPGGRLTHEDRRKIAVWLDDGLGYAEIGRRLGRPTSTISREVARNGASGDYLAARAQQTADHRARRRQPSRSDRSAGSTTDGQPAEAARVFVEEFATLLAATGLPRMTARVFVGLLTADADGRTAADLVGQLRVSPASVSKSIAALESMDLVVRQPDPGTRRERYAIDEYVWQRAWQTDSGAHGDVAAAARRGAQIFGADTVVGARFGRMGQFFGQLSELMNGRTLAASTVHDARTVLAALAHAARPLTVDAMATALDWTPERVSAGLDTIHRYPAIADPLVPQPLADATYTLVVRPDRLSQAQRAALDQFARKQVRSAANNPDVW